jgi:ComF family protein
MKEPSVALRRLLRLWERALFWVFPRRCAWCGAVTEACLALCPRCEAKAAPNDFAIPTAQPQHIACYAYRSPARKQFSQLKFQGKRGLAPSLGCTMAEALLASGVLDAPIEALVCCVPMTQTQQAARGYNQSLLLARAVARQVGAVFAPQLLCKTRETGTQHGLPAHERALNVAGAFAVAENAALQGRRVVLCDDVITTGATLRSCAEALRVAGALEVICLTFLQTVKEDKFQ